MTDLTKLSSSKVTASPETQSGIMEKLQDRRFMLRMSRYFVWVIAVMLIYEISTTLQTLPAPAWFFEARAFFEVFLICVLLLPFTRIAAVSRKAWLFAFVGLVLTCVLFTFLRVIGVMFDAIAAVEAGERLGVPGWSGTLIFVVLSQVPTVLFLRYPDQLD